MSHPDRKPGQGLSGWQLFSLLHPFFSFSFPSQSRLVGNKNHSHKQTSTKQMGGSCSALKENRVQGNLLAERRPRTGNGFLRQAWLLWVAPSTLQGVLWHLPNSQWLILWCDSSPPHWLHQTRRRGVKFVMYVNGDHGGWSYGLI